MNFINGISNGSVQLRGNRNFVIHLNHGHNLNHISFAFNNKFNFFRERLKERAKSHASGSKHKENQQNQKQPSIVNSLVKARNTSDEIKDLIFAMVSSDIPLYKLQDPLLCKVLEKKFGMIPSRKVIDSKYLSSFYEDTMNKIKLTISCERLYFILDEARDSSGRNVLNILAGVLDGKPSKPFLVSVQFIEKTDSCHVSRAFVRTFHNLELEFDDLWLIVTDQASYMVKCFGK
jgi:hypothetical protein